jgi:diaminopimelate epimerase
VRFAKLHGLGNDFVLLDLRGGGEPLPAERAIALCDRHRGVGGDGVLTLLPGDRMLIQNPDGSVPEMCGNGARCAALWMVTAGCTRPGAGNVTLLTDAGPKACAVAAPTAHAGLVEVDMGLAVVEKPRELPIGSERMDAWPVSVGNPHRVMFVNGNPMAMAREFGAVLCRAEEANIEFVTRHGRQAWRAAVYERGAGITQACGTGACAVAAAAVARGESRRNEEILVELPGGELGIVVDTENRVRMRGPAELVFLGDLP